jgi:hypothetical protein
MRKNKKVSNIIYIIIIISLLTFIYSCEKKEPAVKPDPDKIMKKIFEYFPEDIKINKIPESELSEIYSEDKDTPVDLSKIEKYSIIKADENSAVEIGIFKLYDKVNADYVKKMAQTRITKMQSIKTSPVINNAEVRSYGNYVYYVSHGQKDKIFEIIENCLKGV